MIKIKHKQLEALINPNGAELSSLKLHDQEFLWQGDKRYWSGRAPILFPIVGALKDGSMNYRGKRYAMPRHGLARRSNFTPSVQSDNSITMVLKADEQSALQYPWNFELAARFSLSDSVLDIQYEVCNKDKDTMLFTIGSHPAFALELDGSHKLEDYAVQVDQSTPLRRYSLTDDGLLNPQAQSFDAPDNTIVLNNTLFDDDALVFRDISAETIRLCRFGQPVLSIDTNGAPHLGIWSKPGAAFVCIEPWLGTSDFTDSDGNFENKTDLQSLQPNQTFNHSIRIRLVG